MRRRVSICRWHHGVVTGLVLHKLTCGDSRWPSTCMMWIDGQVMGKRQLPKAVRALETSL